MTSQDSTETFAQNLQQDVLALAESDDEGLMLADSFTQTVFDMLSEAGEFEDQFLSATTGPGGWRSVVMAWTKMRDGWTCFSAYTPTPSRPETVTRQQVDVAFRRLRTFLEWCLRGRYTELEESSPVFDMAAHIHGFRNHLAQVRLCVITDGRTTVETLPQDQLGDVTVTSSLWDVLRLHRLSTSGQQREANLHRPQ